MKSTRNTQRFLVLLVIILFISTSINAQEKLSFSEITANTKRITTKYFLNYFELDFDAMEVVMHDDISFHDPTAELIMGKKLVKGKANVHESFRKNYVTIIEMKQEPIRTIFFSNIGIFEVVIKWKFKAGTEKIIAIEMPLIVVLTLKEGKVIEHRDYGDYNYFLKQYKN